MAFDKTQPTDKTKIRTTGVVIRPNWEAIEEGDSSFRPYALNLQNRTPLGVANDPDTIADTYILYEKNDGAGNPELFGKDGSGNIVQLSEGGSLGSKNTNINASTLSFDGGTFKNNQNAMVTAWSSVIVSGGVITSQTNYGMSWVRTATGSYTATFNSSQVNNDNYAVIGTTVSDIIPTLLTLSSTVAKNTSGFGIKIVRPPNSAFDQSFMVTVLGGR